MSDLAKRIADLSPEKRALLTMRLKQKGTEGAVRTAIPPRTDRASYPLSFAQQRMWFLDQLEPGSPMYTIAAALRLQGPLDIDALRRSLDEIARRHEVLRARFVTVKGRPVQVIEPGFAIALPLTDLHHLPEAEREHEALRLATAEAQQPFDLATGPLLRAALIRLAAQDHLVLLTMHHIVSDGWSVGVLTKEIAALYTTFATGQTVPFGELPIQYADFAAWQQEWLAGVGLNEGETSPHDRQLAYWREQLGGRRGPPPALDLPTDRPHPAVQTFRGAHYSFDLDSRVIGRLRELGKQEAATPFMTLLAAFQVLLHRYTGQEDFCIGAPVAGRSRAEVERLIGFFVNTLVLRADLSGEPAFREVLRRTRETALGAYAHQDLPFETLVDELQVTRDMSRTPLFQVAFLLQGAPDLALHASDTRLTLLDIETGASKFDLMLMLTEAGDEVRATFEYNTDLFDSTTIERFAGHFQTLLAGIAADPDRSVGHLPLLTEAELHTLLVAWNATTTAYPRDRLIHQLVEEQATAHPDAIALIFQGETWSYDRLNRAANQLGRYLRRQGIGPGTLVGVCMERSPELIVAWLGILKASGAYTPLDPDYPAERLHFMLEDTRAPIILTQERLAGALPASDARILCLDTGWNPVVSEAEDDLAPIAGPETPAYVIYTSGSTGSPKGVIVPHRAVVRLVKHTDYAPMGPDEVFLQLATVSFDASTYEVWGSLCNGARLVILPPQQPSLSEIGQALREHGVTQTFITTGLFNVLVEEQIESLRGVRRLLTGGDAASPAHFRRMLDSGADQTLVNIYGPTENTTYTTWHPVTREGWRGGMVPIGRPIANTTVYVLDRYMQPVPIGVPGELYTGGDGLALGYLNRPELTAERFLDVGYSMLDVGLDQSNIQLPESKSLSEKGGGEGLCPSHPVPPPASRRTGQGFLEGLALQTSPFQTTSKIYKTGDLVRWLPDGAIEFLGRIDRQVKIRGFRVELGEIEAALAQHPDVREVVVVAREDRPGVKRLAAYVVMGDGGWVMGDGTSTVDGGAMTPSTHHLSPITQSLRGWLRDRLPDHMIPAVFIPLAALPLDPNGKVDRKALPAPNSEETDRGRAYVAPRSAIEQFLADTWKGVLGTPQVGVYDNFFEIGGDSIQAAVLANRLQEELQIGAHVRTIFYAQTVADMAMYFQEHFPEIVAARFGAVETTSLKTKLEQTIEAAPETRVDEGTIARLMAIIPPLPPRPEGPAPKNPPAVFVISPPRSGSTLLRVMLAGHTQLFAPPELELLNFNTLKERRASFGQGQEVMLEGAIRALMEIKGVDTDTATRLMERYERENLSTRAFYALMQEDLNGRLLVDKTPSYSMQLDVLRRAEAEFDEPHYIHLVRHPYATVYSFIEARLHEIFFRYPHPFSVRELAELIWTVSHRHILRFKQEIPPDRYHMVHYEELVARPRETMERICAFLGLPFDEAVLTPYEGKRMTDGIRPMSQMVGDLKFYLRKDIDATAATRWKKFFATDFLGDVGWELARQLGYERPDATQTSTAPRLSELRPIPRDTALPLSFAQQRLWFLDQLDPGSPLYNVPIALRLDGRLDPAALKGALMALIDRHEVLRTTFTTVEGRPHQVIAPAAETALQLTEIDLRRLLPAERKTELARLLADDARQAFDLAAGPLLRATLIRTGDEQHVFALTLHHIVADGWSTGVLVRELTACYAAIVEGRAPQLPELPIQYADYAAWQRAQLEGEGTPLRAQLDYWRTRLAGAPPVIELPTDHARPPVQTSRGARLPFMLPELLSAQVREVSQREGVTPFMTLTAAFKALLHRYSGQDDILVGTPIANRDRAEVGNLIGFFVNTLVLRTDLGGDPSFRDLLGRVRQTTTDAFAHPDAPFEMLVDELQPERSMSHTPIFQVMISLAKGYLPTVQLPGLKLAPINTDSRTAKFDLMLSLVERTDGLLRGDLEYNTDLYEPATIERMLRHFQTLLAAAIADPAQAISRLPLLDEAERHTLLVEWNDTAHPFPDGERIDTLFTAQARRTPDVVAVTYEDDVLTFRQLDERANQLAQHLRALGVGPETIVGLCIDRSVELIVGLLGILKAGGAYLPLDPAYPAERLTYMLEDSGAPVLLIATSGSHPVPAAAGGWTIVDLAADWPAIAGQAPTPPASAGTASNAAYVIYTSGSTGRPKGVVIEHRSAVNLAAALKRAIYDTLPGEQLRISLNAPVSFDASVQQIVMLIYGHTLDIVPQDLRLDGEALLAWMRRRRLDLLDCVPSQLKLLLAAGLLDGQGTAPRLVLPGGEAIDDTTWRMLAHAPATEFFNMYGPTECTVDATTASARRNPERATIGRPLANNQAYILDQHGQLAPIGVVGELYIGGVGVGRGYLNRPELTEARFLDSKIQNPKSKMYKTGDRARWRADGTIEFLGRADQQVKLRGFRIELGEIEAVLKQHPAVGELAVVVREDTPGVSRLVAYVVMGDGDWGIENGTLQSKNSAAPSKTQHPMPNTQLRTWLRDRLPDYMIPSAFVVLPALPLTPNAKVDRKALPAPDGERPALEADYVVPAGHVEQTLAAIWSEVLGVQQVGASDNFFELGGDSILVIQVIARANQAGIRLTPRQLFQHPTIVGLTSVAGVATTVNAEQGPVVGPAPLTPIQRWFFAQGLPAPHHWNQSFLLETHEPLEYAAVEQAVAALLAHHDALRLRFTRTEDGWEQAIAGVVSVAHLVQFIDLAQVAVDQQAAAITQHAAELQASLDLARGPIIRVALFDLGSGQRSRLLITVHHLAIDGVSWRILLEDFYTAYGQALAGQAIQLPPKTTSFRHWAERLQSYARTDELAAELPFWLAQREGPRLPLDTPGGDNSEVSAERVLIALDVEETQALVRDIPATYGADVNDALLTALAQTLTGWTGAPVARIDLEGHGREALFDDVDLSRTVGWFTTLYPVRLDLSAAAGAGTALMAIKEQLRAVPRRGIGYGVLRELGDDAARAQLAALPQADVGFNYLGQFDGLATGSTAFGQAPESAGPVHDPRGRRSHLLAINGSISGGRLRLEWNYSAGLHQRATIERLVQAFLGALHDLIAHCRSAESGGYTPSDFPDIDLSQDDIAALMAEIG